MLTSRAEVPLSPEKAVTRDTSPAARAEDGAIFLGGGLLSYFEHLENYRGF